MVNKLFLLFIFLLHSIILFSQQMSVLECKYQITVTDKDGSHVAIRTYLIVKIKFYHSLKMILQELLLLILRINL